MFLLGLPLVLAGSLDVGAVAAEPSLDPPPGTASVNPDPQWLDRLTGPITTPQGDVPPSQVPPNTPVVPKGGDPQRLVVAGPSSSAATGGLTSSGIPVRVLRAYVAAAQVMAARDPQCHLSWSLLAGIGRVETDHGRYGGSAVLASGRVSPPIYGPLLNGNGFPAIGDTDGGRLDGNTRFDRAVGPMQFIPGTWATYGADGNGDGTADPQNVDDAALAAGRYLCAGSGDLSTPADRWNAVYRYNHSGSYVTTVLGLADSYLRGRQAPLPSVPPGAVTAPVGPPASVGNPPAVTPPTSSGTALGPALAGSGSIGTAVSPTTSPTATDNPTPTDTATPTPTDTPTPTPTDTPTPTPTDTPTLTPSSTPTPTPTDTPTAASTSPTPTTSSPTVQATAASSSPTTMP